MAVRTTILASTIKSGPWTVPQEQHQSPNVTENSGPWTAPRTPHVVAI